ncbi:glucosidase [Hymenobacter sp. DH14]|uniref:Glucosidase n=1 Tax=Hymenobacter cyanobacteriorum TaxID=2926463 RepID=A0A9X1VFF4_9BACT|nr:glucosidase [Hymenobacter cyanobacteriorum]MCI1187157.1 glucosidase [Hymenobacter cyanobacteriorum]
MNPEQTRLQEAKDGTKSWRKFGPYVAERQWGTVREDYSANGDAWNFTTHDQARSRAYRWGEEALAGFCDDQQLLCFGLGLWNGQDAILKERFFGLSGTEGNHGEDVKEVYYYLDATPTHSYQRMLYKYPQHAFPYEWLVKENARRDRMKPEFELMDTAIFHESRYFDVFVEFAKADAEDVLIQLTIVNRGPDDTTLHLLPQLWFRNTWAWGNDPYRPELSTTPDGHLHADHQDLGQFVLYCDEALPGTKPALLFCENATNNGRLYHAPSDEQFFKDGINDYLVQGQAGAVNPAQTGTKAAAHYELAIAPGATRVVRLRLAAPGLETPFADFDQTLKLRLTEADQFYHELQAEITDADARNVQRQAFAGMLWCKQYYYYDVPQWLAGDPKLPPPPPERLDGRNGTGWQHLNNQHIISMPDTWEYPWYAAWDLAFHCLPLARLDPEFAKEQLLLLCRDWYMHPNGQLPAYEWKLSDVNPPVHAYATWRVYKIDQKARGGHGDVHFLETIFHRLLLNFTWWVNRKDRDGRNIFEGGFLGLDNIGVFDRSAPLPYGGYLEQADGTAWVAMYALNMMRIALELSKTNTVYQDLASKFFEHFLYIAEAMTNVGNEHMDLWDDEDEFYYDALNTPDRGHELLKVRSLVGLIPLFAVEVIDEDTLKTAPQFLARMNWFLDNRPKLAALVSRWQEPGKGARHLLSLLRGHRVKRLLARMLDEAEFLSPYGVRSLSRYHLAHPFIFRGTETQFTVNYEPAESQTTLFGGNSNWRGPVWMPMNFLLIESLQRFHHYYGDDFKVEYPTNSGQTVTLLEVADALTKRLTQLFLRDAETGRRACFGDDKQLQNDPNFRDYLWFHEYFHGDNGHGLGASHQTGWTGLIAKLLQPRVGE